MSVGQTTLYCAIGQKELTLTSAAIPAYHELFNPLLNALRELGNSAALIELDDKTAKIMGLSEAALSEPHIRRRGTPEKLLRRPQNFLTVCAGR